MVVMLDLIRVVENSKSSRSMIVDCFQFSGILTIPILNDNYFGFLF